MVEMTAMTEVNTADLIGPALDWAVAEVCGLKPFIDPKAVRGQKFHTRKEAEGCWNDEPWNPSTDWSQGGPLIEKYRVEIVTRWASSWRSMVSDFGYWLIGETPLIAACRAIVAAKLGVVVSVPAELVQP